MRLLSFLSTAYKRRNSLTVEQVASKLGRTTAFVGRMVDVGELHPLPGEPMRFAESEVERARNILERRRRAIEEVHRIDTEERKSDGR